MAESVAGGAGARVAPVVSLITRRRLPSTRIAAVRYALGALVLLTPLCISPAGGQGSNPAVSACCTGPNACLDK